MKYFRYTAETETSSFTNYIPVEHSNFCVICHAVEKTTGDSPEGKETLIFESDSFIRVFQKTVKSQKRDNSGKILTTSYENKEVDQPYNLILSNKEDIQSILNYLNNNCLNEFEKS